MKFLPEGLGEEKKNMLNDKRTYDIRGAAMEVYNSFGPGLLESVYQKALKRELELRGYDVRTECSIPIVYKGEVLDTSFRLDLIIDDTVIIELKSVEDVLPVHFKQLRTYLKLMNLNQGWLINFGEANFADGIYPVWNKTIQTK